MSKSKSKVLNRSERLHEVADEFQRNVVAKRIGLDRYKHFGIPVNWRLVGSMGQAFLAFEMLLAIGFQGSGWSIFGRIFEAKAVPLIPYPQFWIGFCFISLIAGYGLWNNKRWAFLVESLFVTLVVTGYCVSLVQNTWDVKHLESIFWAVIYGTFALGLPSIFYRRYRNYDHLNGLESQGELS